MPGTAPALLRYRAPDCPVTVDLVERIFRIEVEMDGTGLLPYLNHSRSPNVEFDGPELHALRDIAAGEELCFDYGEEWADIP